MNSNICVIGYFGYVDNQLDGQTIKTREIYNLIKNNTESKLTYIDTQELRKKPYLLLSFIIKVRKADVIVYLPGRNNLTKLFKWIWRFKKKRTKIIYTVVGGWLAEFINGNHELISRLSTFDLIGVETNSLKKKLETEYDFKNVEVLPNFRAINYQPKPNQNQEGLKMAFMARVTETKGCDIIFSIAEKIRENSIKDISIGFYGNIDSEYKDRFFSQLSKYGDICRYGGLVEPEKVYEVLNDYDVLLLPTYYEGEGFPGSITDAYKAGIPVMVSEWKDIPEFVDHGQSGFVVKDNNADSYYELIKLLYDDKTKLTEMKKRAFAKSHEYSAEKSWEIIKKYL